MTDSPWQPINTASKTTTVDEQAGIAFEDFCKHGATDHYGRECKSNESLFKCGFEYGAGYACRVPWQPIETAPKDGSRIWLADAKSRVTGFWSATLSTWLCDWHVGKAGDEPTHWMPFPDPPTPEKP